MPGAPIRAHVYAPPAARRHRRGQLGRGRLAFVRVGGKLLRFRLRDAPVRRAPTTPSAAMWPAAGHVVLDVD
ncbi:hypothetical protein SAMD00023353_1501160 [Rosellinia necatrix]|uniref:Uncharacterized protein n=1 Tax=Rosellinia necatrix TaxID=77044 RepID=A0A1S8A722_ROSNE|nr:hypothetical protein SAMD00023353_1501160 [Rosellinia necatrix]